MGDWIMGEPAWGYALAALAGALCGLLAVMAAQRLVEGKSYTAAGYFNAVAVSMVGFAVLLFVLGWSVQWVAFAALFAVLETAALTDLSTRTIPNVLVGAVVVVWVAYQIAMAAAGFPFVLPLVAKGLIGALVTGGFVLVASLAFEKITGKQSLGGGDIKLLFAVGLFLGWADGLFCVVIAYIIGLTYALLRRDKKQESAVQGTIPFGPAIGLATMCLLALYGPLLF